MKAFNSYLWNKIGPPFYHMNASLEKSLPRPKTNLYFIYYLLRCMEMYPVMTPKESISCHFMSYIKTMTSKTFEMTCGIPVKHSWWGWQRQFLNDVWLIFNINGKTEDKYEPRSVSNNNNNMNVWGINLCVIDHWLISWWDLYNRITLLPKIAKYWENV